MDGAVSVAHHRVHRSARVEQRTHHSEVTVVRGGMQRRHADVIAASRQRWIATELLLDTREVSVLCLLENRCQAVLECEAARELLTQHRRHGRMPAILGDREEGVLEGIAPVGRIDTASVHQEPNESGVAFADGEVKWGRVVVLVPGQPGMASDERLHLIQIAGVCREVHAPYGICRSGAAIGKCDNPCRAELEWTNGRSVRRRGAAGWREPLDVVHERSPALEAVLARENELRVGERQR